MISTQYDMDEAQWYTDSEDKIITGPRLLVP